MENSIFDGPTFNTMHFDRNPVTYPHAQGEKSLNEFEFGTFIVRFPSDGPACWAVKGLNFNTSSHSCLRNVSLILWLYGKAVL